MRATDMKPRRPVGGADSLKEHQYKSLYGEGSSWFDNTVLPVTSSMMKNAQVKSYPGADDIMSEVTFDDERPGEYTQHLIPDLDEITARFLKGFVLERPQGMSYHHLIDYLERVSMSDLRADKGFWQMLAGQRSFVIEHDWHRAFESGKDFVGGGDVRLPYNHTCFEFRISGVRVLALCVTSTTDHIWVYVAVGINKRWYLDPKARCLEGDTLVERAASEDLNFATRKTGYEMHGLGQKLADFLANQIRACCIVLDAGVAVAPAVPPSQKQNAKREKHGRLALKPYHVVSLRPRKTEPRESQGGTHASPRFHWRRGHWRHFDEAGSGRERYIDDSGHTRSRTWINWMPVGDIDLGFVDKHYKL